MRTFLALLFLAALPLHAAVTVTSRGTSSNNSAGTSIVITPASNFAVGSWGVLVIAMDNPTSGGAGISTSTPVSDSVGNVWTRRIAPIYDAAAGSAGVEMAFYTAPITVAFTTANNLTLTVTSMTAKAWVLWEVTPTSNAFTMSYVTGAAGTGSAADPSVVTSSITSGDVVIAGAGAESADTWSGDADTSNGNWSTHEHTAAGTGATGMSVTSQYKVVTGTATQTYNPLLTDVDNIPGWIQLREIPAATGNFFQLF